MQSFWQDIRFTLRTFRRNPRFALVAVTILGLAVGAATAIFGIVNSVLIKPLPYVEPSRLVAITRVLRPERENVVGATIAIGDLRAWAEHSTSFASMGALFFTRIPVRVGDTAYLPNTGFIDSGLLPTLGVAPAIGTNFEGVQAVDETVIISHGFWQRAFDGAADVIGQTINVSGRPLTVRGVLPQGFQVPRTDARFYRGTVDLFMPALAGFQGGNDWGIARLAPGVSIEQAEAELRGVVAGLQSQTMPEGWTARLTPLTAERTQAVRQPLLSLLGIGAVLLLIACTNLVNLLLARSTARTQELAVRSALGAGTGRLVRQQLTESLCLAVAGGALGIAIAAIGIRIAGTLAPLRLPVIQGITLDARVLAFGFAISVAAALIVGAVPALFSTLGIARSKAPGSGMTARAFPRTQRILTIAQIGLSVGLLASAGVLSHSLWRIYNVERGFDSEQVLGFQLAVPAPGETAQETFITRALEAIDSIPGVDSTGYITFLPPETWAGFFAPFRIDGPPPQTPPRAQLTANTLSTSADYFETVGMSLLSGRRFDATDTRDSPPVAIVNEVFASTFMAETDPLGGRIVSQFDTRLGRDDTAREIVGIVNATRDRGLDQQPLPVVYIPYTQGVVSYGAIALRAQIAPDQLIPEVRRRLNAINPDVPLSEFQTIDERIRESLRQPRFYAFLALSCAVLAALFVAVGLYGVVAYSVSRRTVELGVRMALGAPRGRVMLLVLRQGAVMAAIGAGLGLLLAVATTRALSSLLFEVEPLDPLTLAGSVALVIAIALLAALLPARRACRLNLTTALRHD